MLRIYRVILWGIWFLHAAEAETHVIESSLSSLLPAFPFVGHDYQVKIDESEDYLDAAVQHAKAGSLEATIALLQRAAHEQECTVEKVKGEASFDALRSDARWEKLRFFLEQSEAAWPQSSFSREVLTLPAGYDGKKALPLVLGLHGFGSIPEDFSGSDFQKIADQLQIAFLAVSGKTALNRQSFMWSARFEEHWEHIQAAIQRSRKLLKIAPNKMIVIGFSQGGALAADLCAAFPQTFLGGIIMSPGARHSGKLSQALAATSDSHDHQTYFFSWIQGEGEGTKQRSRESKEIIEQHNAMVCIHEFPGKGHNFPPNYADYFSITIQVILKRKR